MFWSISFILVLAKFFAGIFASYLAYFMYQRVFRAGVFEQGIRFIVISIFLLTVGRALDVITAIQPNGPISTLWGPVISTAFSLILAYGFYTLYKVWRIDRKDSRVETRAPLVN